VQSLESEQSQVYYSIVYDKPFLGGFFNANQPEQFTRISPVMKSFPSDESVALLKQLGVTYVVVEESQYTDFTSVDDDIRMLGLSLVYNDGTDSVYILP
jgi:hypothetical protein